MKLNESYIAVQYEEKRLMKDFFLFEHLHEKHKATVMLSQVMAQLTGAIYDKKVKDPWEQRVQMAIALTQSPKHLKKYLITKTVQEGASKINFDKIDLKWFKDLPSMEGMYILNKNEFYRFQIIEGYRINVLHFFKKSDIMVMDIIPDLVYDSWSIILEEGVLAAMPSQDKEIGETFVKLLLFIEKSEIEYYLVQKRSGKVVFGKGDEGKVRNESGIDVTVVNSNWNKVLIMQGETSVEGHFKLIWVGAGRTQLALRWWSSHTRGAHVRRAGKDIQKDKEE
jgi:hypothetical protein